MPIALRVRLATDVDPAALTLAFPDELIQVHVVHQSCTPFLALFDGRQANVCRLPPPQMLAVGLATHGTVQCRAAIAGGEEDGYAHSLSQGLQHLHAERAQRGNQVGRHPVVNAQSLGRPAFSRSACKKLAKKFGGLKERRTFAPAIERTTQVVERERNDL